MSTSCAVETGYCVPAAAADMLTSRESLKPLIEEWWNENGWGLCSIPNVPRPAVLARQLASFRYEDATFALMAQGAGMTPVWLSYNGDNFHTSSSLKRSYLHPIFCSGLGKRKGLPVLHGEKIAKMDQAVGRSLDSIVTNGGSTLVQYHNAHQDRVFPGAVRGDNTAWVRQMGGVSQYYLAYLSMFIAHGVLFEDYHGGESGSALDSFTQDVFEPAYAGVLAMFGVCPIITKLPWWNEMRYYPADPNWRDHGIKLLP